jgi:hypothetical protein
MRDLEHHQIKVRVYDNSDQIYQDAVFYLDEVFPGIFEAETRMTLMVEPSDLSTDIQAAMIANRISGTVYKQIDYSSFPKNVNISI